MPDMEYGKTWEGRIIKQGQENSQEVTFSTTVADLRVLCAKMRKGDSLELMERTALI